MSLLSTGVATAVTCTFQPTTSVRRFPTPRHVHFADRHAPIRNGPSARRGGSSCPPSRRRCVPKTIRLHVKRASKHEKMLQWRREVLNPVLNSNPELGLNSMQNLRGHTRDDLGVNWRGVRVEDAKKRRRKAWKAVARRKEEAKDDVKEKDERRMRARRAAMRRGRAECMVRGEGNAVVHVQA